MNEIEIKAHVKDRNKLIKRLNEIAVYENSVIRDDTYYSISKADGSSKKHKIRIRKETYPENPEKQPVYLVTYKRKERKTDENGISIEVNDEKECTISDPEPLEAFLLDSGYTVHLKKHKEVMDWKKDDATLELCNVPPLGDFLEIEILSSSSDENIIKECHNKLEKLLESAEIPKEDIENRYYSDLLKEARKNQKKGEANV